MLSIGMRALQARSKRRAPLLLNPKTVGGNARDDADNRP